MQLNVSENHFFLNMFNVLQFESAKNIEKLRKPVNRDRWTTEPAIVNAFYSPHRNDIGKSWHSLSACLTFKVSSNIHIFAGANLSIILFFFGGGIMQKNNNFLFPLSFFFLLILWFKFLFLPFFGYVGGIYPLVPPG